MPIRRTLSRHYLTVGLTFLFLCLLAIGAQAQRGQTDARTVSGIVSDPDHEPIRGAVVELENSSTHEVISFITAADGHYIFHRIDSHTDFRIWATFRNQKSAIHNISMFDDHIDKVIGISLRPY
jgi:hypothetical protein